MLTSITGTSARHAIRSSAHPLPLTTGEGDRAGSGAISVRRSARTGSLTQASRAHGPPLTRHTGAPVPGPGRTSAALRASTDAPSSHTSPRHLWRPSHSLRHRWRVTASLRRTWRAAAGRRPARGSAPRSSCRSGRTATPPPQGPARQELMVRESSPLRPS